MTLAFLIVENCDPGRGGVQQVTFHIGTSRDLRAIHDDAASFSQNYFQRTNAWSKMLNLPHQQ
jgi:hypothetical protein